MDNDQLLRSILLTGTPRETETFFIAHRGDVNASIRESFFISRYYAITGK